LKIEPPALAFATMPWEYPPGVERKCAAGLAETYGDRNRRLLGPITTQASPHSGLDTLRSWRSQSAASTTSG
jgi:hypothetical protein